jgi:hypothetical protein
MFQNYKNSFSVALEAVCDAGRKSVCIDMGVT